MTTLYKIHPSIGIARLGTSEDFYVAPETPGGLPTNPDTGQPVTSFRDAQGHLLKQAQRFRVFAYDDANPSAAPAEVVSGSGGVQAIEWTVYLANKKACWYEFKQLTGSGQEGDAGYIVNGPTLNPLRNVTITDPTERQQLIIDPGPRTIGGQGNPVHAVFDATGPFSQPSNLPFPITSVGSIDLDAQGNLLVIGASGASGTTNINPAGSSYEYIITHYANNDGWFDDVADGPVSATLVMQDGTRVPVGVPAWCLSVPPKYAPQIFNLVTLYDTMYDIAVRELNANPSLFGPNGFDPNYLVDFASEIGPFLSRPRGYGWVAQIGRFGDRAHRTLISSSGSTFPLNFVREPSEDNDQPTLMPILAGDNPISDLTISKYLTVTQTQYFILSQWVAGKVRTTPAPAPSAAAQLDQAALENCTGGAFCPGIEMTWVSRNKTVYTEPFRLRVKANVVAGQLSATYGDDNNYAQGLEPGDVLKYMAQPWQADFNECSTQPITDDPTSNSNGTQATFWWWPAERPYSVYETAGFPQVQWTRGFEENGDGTPQSPNLGDMQMVICWEDMGFIIRQQDGSFLEIERDTAAVDAYEPPLRKDVKMPIVAAAAPPNRPSHSRRLIARKVEQRVR